MRKLFLWAVLAVMICSVSIASASEVASSDAFSSFGLYRVYSNDNPVILRVGGDPDYSDVKSLQCTNLRLAARVKDDYSGTFPSGTLTFTESGLRYQLIPSTWDDSIAEYFATGITLANYAGSKIMWNIYTSPNVIAGSAVIPDVSSLTKTLSGNEIVPHLRLVLSDSSNVIERADLCFVRSGDWSTAVTPDVSTVKVYVNGSSESGYDPYVTFTNFNKPVRKSINLDMTASLLESIAVEYEKDGAKYIWNFNVHGLASAIDWGKLALSSQPLTLKTGETAKIDVMIPAVYSLSGYFAATDSQDIFTIGNSSVLSVDVSTVSFTQGSLSWSGLTANETKSTLSFTLKAGQTGRTTLTVNIPGLNRTYYREVRVTDRNGRLNLSSSNTSGTYIKVKEYSIYARTLNGRPYYPSAELENIDFVISADSNDDLPESGFLGLSVGTWSEIHYLSKNGDSDNTYTISYSGAGWDTLDSSDNTENASMNITAEDIDNASVWWEFPDNASMNVASASLKAVISGDYMTSNNPLSEFVPYFEMKHDPESIDHITSFNVYFVNPNSMARVTPDISDASISYWYDWYTHSSDVLPKEGKSLPISYYSSASGAYDGGYHDTINISYTYNDAKYSWRFVPMRIGSYGYITDFAMSVNSSKTLNVGITNSSDLEAVDFMIWDNEILSADPVNFAPADEISFDVAGLQQGNASAVLVFTENDGTSYDKHRYSYVIVRVVSTDEEAQIINMGSSDLNPEFIALTSYASIVEGVPSYYYSDDTEQLYVNLNRVGYLPSDYAYSNNIFLTQSGTLHIYSNDEEISTEAMYPSAVGYYYDDEGAEYIILSYGSYLIPEGSTSIEWTTSNDIMTSGSADVSSLTPRSTEEQLTTYKPFIKLNREGLNVSTLEYYFADSLDNEIATPDSVDNVNVYVGSVVNEDDSGVITLNTPEIYISGITFTFRDNGINYAWEFQPVDNPYLRTSYDVISWDVSSPDLPLVMRVGDTYTLTLTAQSLDSPSAVVGNTAIVSLDELSSSDSSVTVMLTALSAGMTSITLTDGANMSWPREIWVADSSGRVPHLTTDIDALIARLSSGTSGDIAPLPETTSPDTPADEPSISTGEPVAVLEGLSVYPRFALPTDPSGDAYNLAWQKVYDENSPYGVFIFEDDVNVLASRDVMSVFDELSMDLISRYPAQLLAVVLPELEVTESGTYTFRIPIDNVVLPGTKIFMHTYQQESYSNLSDEDNDEPEIPDFPDVVIPSGMNVASSGDMNILTNSYMVLVSVDRGSDGLAALRITSSDIALPECLKYSVRSIDSAGNVLALRITANEKYYDLDEMTEGVISIPYTSSDNEAALEWPVIFPADNAGMDYYTDDGTELEYISGDEYVNVAVYLSAGRYQPVITAKAISNDIRLIAGLPDIPDDDPISLDVSPDISTDVSPDVSPDVKPESPDNPAPIPGTESGDTPSPTPGIESGDTPSPTPGTESGDTPSPQPQTGNESDDNREDIPGGSTTPNSGDNSGGGSTHEDTGNTMIPAAPTKPTVNVEDGTLMERIITAIQGMSSRILGSSEVLELPNDAVGTQRSELTDYELAIIPSTETPVIILPLMRVNTAAVYVFGVNITNLLPGARIFLYMMPEYVSSTSGLNASATDYDAYMFLDDNAAEIQTVPANGHVNIAVYMEPDVVYAPVITTPVTSSGGNNSGGSNSGGNNSGGNNSGGNNTGDNTTTDQNLGSSGGGGGCNIGGTFTILMLAVMAFTLRRR